MAASWSTQSAAGQAMKVGSGSRLWENVRTHCQDATTESKTQSRRIFDTRAACCLNQSCAQIAHKMVFAQPRSDAVLRTSPPSPVSGLNRTFGSVATGPPKRNL